MLTPLARLPSPARDHERLQDGRHQPITLVVTPLAGPNLDLLLASLLAGVRRVLRRR